MSPIASYILQTLATLLGAIALGALVVAVARRAGVGRSAGPLQLVGRLPLDGRHAVYLVRVADRLYVLGSGGDGLQKLGELAPEVLGIPPLQDVPLRDTLRRVIAGRLPEDRR